MTKFNSLQEAAEELSKRVVSSDLSKIMSIESLYQILSIASAILKGEIKEAPPKYYLECKVIFDPSTIYGPFANEDEAKEYALENECPVMIIHEIRNNETSPALVWDSLDNEWRYLYSHLDAHDMGSAFYYVSTEDDE